jgi:hypothetical protein
MARPTPQTTTSASTARDQQNYYRSLSPRSIDGWHRISLPDVDSLLPRAVVSPAAQAWVAPCSVWRSVVLFHLQVRHVEVDARRA